MDETSDLNIKKDKDEENLDFSQENLDDSVLVDENQADTIKKLKEKLKKALEEKQKYLDSWQRDKAEFINSRRRDKDAIDEFRSFAKEDVILDLLPILDSFTMAFSNKEAWEKVDTGWRTGVEYIYSQLVKTLQNQGLVEVNPVGELFDPARDEAVEYIPVSEKENNHKILDVVAKGYSLNNKIIKPPKVKVGEYKKE